MAAAHALNSSVKVTFGRGRDEEVIGSGVELQGTGGRAESPEADCEVSQAEWLVTLGNDSGMC